MGYVSKMEDIISPEDLIKENIVTPNNVVALCLAAVCRSFNEVLNSQYTKIETTDDGRMKVTMCTLHSSLKLPELQSRLKGSFGKAGWDVTDLTFDYKTDSATIKIVSKSSQIG